MTAFTKLAGVQTKTTLREPAAAFFMLAFGPLFALIMGAVLDNGPQGEFDSSLPGFAGIVVAITSFVLLPIDIVSQRDNGALRRFRATPLRPLTFIAADLVTRFVLVLISLTAMLLLGMGVFGATPQGHVGSVLLATALGILTFLSVGYALTALLPSHGVAQAVGNILVYPLIMLSGAAFPLAAMPDQVRQVAQFSPLTQFVTLLDGLWSGDTWDGNWVALIVLFGVLGVATTIAARFFRWE